MDRGAQCFWASIVFQAFGEILRLLLCLCIQKCGFRIHETYIHIHIYQSHAVSRVARDGMLVESKFKICSYQYKNHEQLMNQKQVRVMFSEESTQLRADCIFSCVSGGNGSISTLDHKNKPT